MGMSRQVLLSRETGRLVLTADGARVGRLVDLTVLLDEAHPVVHRVGVGSGRHLAYLVPWSAVDRIDGPTPTLTLAVDRAGLSRYRVGPDPELEEHELLLCRDVLDTQVVDLVGRRLSRVSDVVVATRPGGEIEIVAVDVGFGSLLRRMGLPRVATHLDPVLVDWEDLHLTSSRGHVVQLATSTTGMHRLDPEGLAELLARLSTEKATDVMRTVGPARSARALHASHPVLRHRLLHSLEPGEAQHLIDAAAPATSESLAKVRRSPAVPRRRLRTAGWRVHRPPRHLPPRLRPSGRDDGPGR
jgi:sporulation protein YlmC with PRC-barrel domain